MNTLNTDWKWLLCTALLVTCFCLADAKAEWPVFRGPTGDGIASADCDPPVRWSRDQNVKWRTELPGSGWSSPVVKGWRVYVSAAIPTGDEDSGDLDLCLLILDSRDGKLLKTAPLLSQKGKDTPRTHKKNSHASPTPIVTNDHVYVHFGYQGTVCTDLDGRVVWKNRELFYKPTHGNGGTPVLVGDRLIFTCDGDKEPKVAALDAATGKIAWTTRRPVKAKKTFSFCTPTVMTVQRKQQVIVPGSDCVLGLDPASGDIVWEVHYTGYSVVPKPVHDNQRVYVSTSFDNAKLLAIRPDGTGEVTQTHVDWQLDKSVSKTPSMIANDGLIHFVSDDGIATCVDTETGDVKYRKRLGGNFSASPVLAAGRLYFLDEGGTTTVVQAGEKFTELAKNELGERALASPAVVGNAIVVRTAEAIYWIEEGAK